MVSWSGWRFFRAACLLVALGAVVDADEAAVEFESQREQLAVLQPMIGSWKGVGLQKRGGNARWAATTEWAWSFADGQAAIVFTTEPGRYFSRGRLVPGAAPETFRLTLEQAGAKQSATFVGQWDGSGLDLSNERAEPGQPARLLVKNVADNKRLVITVQTRTPSGGYQQIAVLGYTREGVVFAVRQRPLHECVVTGGEGNQRVMYQGQEYWVCCKGCLNMFEDNPEKVIAAHEARIAKREQAARKQVDAE